MHVTAGCAILAGEVDANWNASLQNKRRFFAYMNYDFNTLGYYSVSFSYWCLEAAGITVYYSTDGGTNWIFLDDTFNGGSWSKRNISDSNFDNQATLRFGFVLDDAAGGSMSNFPSIDAVEIYVPDLTCDFFYEDLSTVCETYTVTFTNQSLPED